MARAAAEAAPPGDGGGALVCETSPLRKSKSRSEGVGGEGVGGEAGGGEAGGGEAGGGEARGGEAGDTRRSDGIPGWLFHVRRWSESAR